MKKNFWTKALAGITGIWLKNVLIMKLTFLLLCVNVFCAVGSTYSQHAKFTLSGKNVQLEDVINEIKEQSDFRFFYNHNLIDVKKRVNYKVEDATISEILGQVFFDTGIKYEIVDKTIILSPKEKEAEKRVEQLQKKTIKGTVTDKMGQPLPGVTILVKGTTTGTTTDVDGIYSIEIQPNVTLVFSYVGFEKQEIDVSAQTNTQIDIVMNEDIAELSEVNVISTGLQKIKPEHSTGSISKIEVKEYDSRVNTTDFLSGLVNKIPGLLINSDIEFDGNSLFQIRGISTINGNKQPLIVIDGFPTELSIDMINPNEIESVTVLKDAAAATVYGVRASNGVIVIEQKKAKAGDVKVNFRTTVGFKPKEDYGRYRWDEDASNISIDYYRFSKDASIRASTWKKIISPTSGWNYNYPTPGLIMAQEKAEIISSTEAEQQFAELGSYNNTEDYENLFLRMATTQTYNLNISGGDKKALYYITANYTNNNKSQIKNKNNSFRLSGRTTVKFTKKFSMELSTDLQQSNTYSVPIPGINNIYTYERLQDEDGNPLSIYNGSYANPYYNDVLMEMGFLDNMYYPLVDIDEIQDNSSTLNNRVTANFRYNIADKLNFNFGGVYERSSTETKHIASENSSEMHQYINYYTEMDDDGALTYNIPIGGYLQQQTASTESYTLRAQFNYNKQIDKNHSFNAILGGEIRKVVDKSNSAAYFGYNDQTLLHQSVDYKIVSDFSTSYAKKNPTLSYDGLFGQGYADNRYVSMYTNIVYSYRGKYSFSGSVRIDQSNLFGTDPKYHYKPLWSLGASWNIHKENFMQDMIWVNSLKLRLAYGFNGNVAKQALPQVIAQAGFNYYNSSYVIPMLSLLSYANSGLRWEQTENFNIGLDFSIFKNINGSIDYYTKKSTDLLATSTIEATKGATTALINQASIRNNGIEVNMHADWITRRRFNWNTGLVLSHNTSMVLEVYNNEITPESDAREYASGDYINYLKGYPVGAVFSYRYAGVDSYGYPLIYDKDGETKRILTLDEGIDDVDYEGTAIPKINIGLSNRVDVGNFYFYCMVNFYGGFKVRVPIANPGSLRPLEGAGNYWKEEGDEEDPDVIPKSYTQYAGYTDKYTVNGAYITLGDLTAAYSFRNSKLVQNTRFSNLELRLQGSNLYTVGFNKYNYSIATGSYAKPYLTPTYTIGLYLNF